MPGKIKVKILAGRNLPVMDRSGDTTDAYVELKFGNTTYKTDVCRKSLNPQWNSEWYKFEVDDAELQDEPLQIRLMDHDTYSANDAIGKVYINLNPLLLPGVPPTVKNIWTLEASMNTSTGSHSGSVMSGWIPVYDTMHGIRGEVNIIVKVELFSDFNKFRQSSCGVQFFYSPNVPCGYHAQVIHGFVEELIVCDDPEYKWIDKIRTPRASNEARQTLFLKLSGEVQRKIGLKALDLGGNAVIGYLQNFDLEGEPGIVARGIGTAVTLIKLHDALSSVPDNLGPDEPTIGLYSRRKRPTVLAKSDGGSGTPSPVPGKRVGVRGEFSKKIHEHTNSQTNLSEFDGKTLEEWKQSSLKLGSTCSAFASVSPPKRDSLIDESSVKALLALEDMRGESSSMLSRHLRNLKHLPQSVLGLRSHRHRGSDSFEEESDLDSLYSSTLSIGGSDSAKSAIIDPIRAKRKKRPLHKKSSGEGMASLLIRSVHNNIILDSVKEDRETPTSSPIHFSNNSLKSLDEKVTEEIVERIEEERTVAKVNTDGVDKIPMIYSSESDTSSSDEEPFIPDDQYSQFSDTGLINSILPDVDVMNISLPTKLKLLPRNHKFVSRSKILKRSRSRRVTSLSNEFSDVGNESESLQKEENDTTLNINPEEKALLVTDSSSEGELFLFDKSYDKSPRISRSETIIFKKGDDERLLNFGNESHGEHLKVPTEIFGEQCNEHENTSHEHNVESVTIEASCEQNVENVMIKTSCEQNVENVTIETSNEANIEQIKPSDIVSNGENNEPLEVVSTEMVNKTVDKHLQTSNGVVERPAVDPFRLKSMRELINIIDTKMMVKTSHHHKSESPWNRRKTHKNRDKYKNHTPSPDVNRSRHQRVTQSRLLEKHSHSHNKPNPVASPNNPTKLTSSSLPCDLSKIAADQLSNDSHRDCNDNQLTIELREFEMDYQPSHAVIRKSIVNVKQTTSTVDAKITNIDSVTDNTCCVSLPSPYRRQTSNEMPISPSCPIASVSTSMGNKPQHSPSTKAQQAASLHRRSSDSDLSITPKGNSLAGSDRSVGGFLRPTAVIRTMNQDAIEMLEYPFLTMQLYPPEFLLHIGGLVSSRSVKLLERISNLEEPESRDSWWTEIRMEVRSHARALACNVVIGYKEETSICDDVCVLNASGTAAVINLQNVNPDQDVALFNRLHLGSVSESDRERILPRHVKHERVENGVTVPNSQNHINGRTKSISESNDHEMLQPPGCSICHLPYNDKNVPFRINASKCAICKRSKVPDVMFMTIELPENVQITGRGCLIQATVCKNKRDLRGELNAKEISDCLPFLEYELHSLLLNKLRVKGMNAIFGLKVQVSIGERLMIGMAVGTAVYLTALPPPTVPQIASGNSWNNEEQLADIKKSLLETVKKNKEFYRLKIPTEVENGRPIILSDTDESDEDMPDMDLGSRDTCILEVDDIEDIDRIQLLMNDRSPEGFHIVNTQAIPGLEDMEIVRNLQMFTQVSRAKIPLGQSALMPSKYFARLLQTIYFKLRRMVPCALCDLQFRIALPEADEIQLSVVGMALGLGEPLKLSKPRKKAGHMTSKDQLKKIDDNDMIFSLDEDHAENLATEKQDKREKSPISLTNSASINALTHKPQSKSPLRPKVHKHKHVPLKERYGVDITPLAYLPSGRIDRYLGNFNFFFIRESTSIRENGGLSGFTHSFVMEVLAIVRAHITALGGNAMVSFFMTQCILSHSPHKNQGQCLINVGGDVVYASYYENEKHIGSNC